MSLDPQVDDYREAVCRGSWLLGTACGHCLRCLEEATQVIPKLRADAAALNNKLQLLASCIPPKPPTSDFIDSVKLNFFHAARLCLYGNNRAEMLPTEEISPSVKAAREESRRLSESFESGVEELLKGRDLASSRLG